MKSTRQDILAEINALKIMVFNLWETHYGSIDKQQFNEFKEEIRVNMPY